MSASHEGPVAPGFSSSYRVRFDECGPDGLVRASSLLRYTQDVAWLHSEGLGFDRDWYANRGIGWLVRAAEVVVEAPIPMGASLELVTRVVGHRKVWARRRTEAFRDGSRVAWTHTDWVLIDGRGIPARIPPVFDQAFPNPVADFPIGRVDLGAGSDPGIEPERRTFHVRPHELDPNDHVNNAVFVDWLEEAIGREVLRRVPRRYRIEYAAPAAPDDELSAETWSVPDGWLHRLRRAGGGELVRAHLSA